MLGLSLTCDGKTLLLLNVYLPYTRITKDEVLTIYIGKISSVISDCVEENFCVIGDFNCSPDSERFQDLSAMLSENVNLMCDVMKLPSDTFTHVNYR